MCLLPMLVWNSLFIDFFTTLKLTLNLGMAISKPILEQTLDEYKKQMSVNGTSPTSPLPQPDITDLTSSS